MQILQPVVFLPGTLCDERVWMPVWGQLNCPQKAYVPLQWAENFQHMMMLTEDRVDSFSEPVHLVGFSMGGYIASQYAISNPHKVASLTLIGYCSEGLSKQELTQRQLLIKTINNKKYKGSSIARTQQFLHKQNHTSTELTREIMAMSDDLGASVLKAHISACTPRPSLTKQLASRPFEINIIGAEADLIVPPKQLDLMHSSLDNSHFDMITEAGHMMMLEQPTQVASLLSRKIA